MKLGEKIMYARKRAGMSQIDLADALGVSRQSVSKWETGEANPDITKLPQLADVLGVTVDWLFSNKEPAEGYPAGAGSGAADDPASRDAEEDGSAAQKNYPDWLEHLPGFMLQAAKKYGWIYGLIIAGAGAIFAGFGVFIRIMFSRFTSGIAESFPGAGPSPAMQQAIRFSGPNMISGAIMVIGALIMIFGIVLAAALRSWGKKD